MKRHKFQTVLFVVSLVLFAAGQAASAQSTSEGWTISGGKDSFTDEQSFGLTISAEGMVSHLTTAGLMFSCEGENSITVGVFWLDGAPEGDEGTPLSVDWRVGDLRYHQSDWSILINKLRGPLIISSKTDAGAIANEMSQLDGSGVTFRIRSELAYAEFPIAGFASKWPELVAKCQTLGG